MLLIVAALEQPELRAAAARARGSWAWRRWSRCTTSEELARAVDSGARVIGVNNRNLRTLAVDVDASYRLAARMPRARRRRERERAAVARATSSGWRRGYRAFLIGERFMTDPDPARRHQRDLIGVARGRRTPGSRVA